MKMIIDLLKNLFNIWKKVTNRIGQVVTVILLTITYFTVIGITSIISKCLRKDLLYLKRKPSNSYWIDREIREETIETCSHHF